MLYSGKVTGQLYIVWKYSVFTFVIYDYKRRVFIAVIVLFCWQMHRAAGDNFYGMLSMLISVVLLIIFTSNEAITSIPEYPACVTFLPDWLTCF